MVGYIQFTCQIGVFLLKKSTEIWKNAVSPNVNWSLSVYTEFLVLDQHQNVLSSCVDNATPYNLQPNDGKQAQT